MVRGLGSQGFDSIERPHKENLLLLMLAGRNDVRFV